MFVVLAFAVLLCGGLYSCLQLRYQKLMDVPHADPASRSLRPHQRRRESARARHSVPPPGTELESFAEAVLQQQQQQQQQQQSKQPPLPPKELDLGAKKCQ